MVLLGQEEEEAPILQIDLGFHDEQEDIISKLHVLS